METFILLLILVPIAAVALFLIYFIFRAFYEAIKHKEWGELITLFLFGCFITGLILGTINGYIK